ncbi:MAG: outer membrane lipid asymmetry maintenance protein MlaD [Verrucomicrobia bacterium]|nr:MAG: outer membrane lipid asymmetry maintenance protein MlaD [Verrucomicrobiota bacterium]
MRTNRLELFVGTFVVLGLAAVAYLALSIGGGALMGEETYMVSARFSNVGGLNPGARVAISGVTVGKVEAVRLNTEDYSAIVDMRIRADVQLPVDSIVSVKTSGLIGDKYLAVQPGVEMDYVGPGGLLTETESAVDIESLVSRFAFGSVQQKQERDEP